MNSNGNPRILLAVLASLAGMRPAPAGDREALQGVWRVAAVRQDIRGDTAAAAREMLAHGTIAFVGDTMTMQDIGSGRDSRVAYAFALDTTVSPCRIDLAGEGSSAGGEWRGIYRLAGDTLTLALPIEHWSDRPVRPAGFGGANTIALILVRAGP